MPGMNRRTFVGTGLAGSTAIAGAVGNGLSTELAGEDSHDGFPGRTPYTKFAVNLEMWYTDLPFLERIREAALMGFPAVEFWPYENKDIPTVAALAKELNIQIAQFTAWGFTPGMNDPANEDAVVKKIQESCQVAHQLDCRKMTVVAGDNQQGMTQQQMLDQVVKALKRVVPIIEQEKVMLILEPMNGRVDHPGHCLYGSPDAVRICREVDSEYVKINWDLYHMQITEGDLCGRLRDGFDQVGYLQLADHPGRYEPGTGEIHYNRVLKEAYDLGYRGFVGLECRPQTGELAAARAVAAADVWKPEAQSG